MEIVNTKLPAFDGVLAGQTATCRLPLGVSYHSVAIAFSGIRLNQMGEIRVIGNNKVFQRYTAEQIALMNYANGDSYATTDMTDTTIDNGTLVLNFIRPKLKTFQGELLTALNTQFDPQAPSFRSLTIEIDIAVGVTSPVISATATQSAGTTGGVGTILNIFKQVRDIAGAGTYDVADVPRGTITSKALNRVVFFEGGGAITKVVVERNNRILFDREKALNDFMTYRAWRFPIPDAFIIDRCEGGFGGAGINLIGASDFRYKLTVNGASTIDVVSEYLGSLGD